MNITMETQCEILFPDTSNGNLKKLKVLDKAYRVQNYRRIICFLFRFCNDGS